MYGKNYQWIPIVSSAVRYSLSLKCNNLYVNRIGINLQCRWKRYEKFQHRGNTSSLGVNLGSKAGSVMSVEWLV